MRDLVRLFRIRLSAEKPSEILKRSGLELSRYLHLDNEVASLLFDSALNGFNGTF